MSNQYIEQIRQHVPFEYHYNVFGEVIGVQLVSATSSTTVPVGNNNFNDLINYIESNNLSPTPKITWVQIKQDKNANVLYYICDLGEFVDTPNPITNLIKKLIKSQKIEIRETEAHLPIEEIQVSIFLPRAFTILDRSSKPISQYAFDTQSLGLELPIQICLMQKIEPNYFEDQKFLSSYIMNLAGNVIRIRFESKNIGSIYNWSKNFLESELARLNDSMNANIALHKRSKGRGPTTNWYFDWMTLPNYIWAPILEITNRVIAFINNQAHRKTISLISRDDLGDIVLIKAIKTDGTHVLCPLSNLRDQQINIFPTEFNWNSPLIDRSFNKIRYLLDRSLYFEAVVVAQAALEAIINGMFPLPIKKYFFHKNEIKWEEKYQHLKKFINQLENGHYLKDKDSALYFYLDGGLHRIYQLRNKFAHDIFENQPNYDFKLSELKETTHLLTPITDYLKSRIFLDEVREMQSLLPEFIIYLKQQFTS